MVAECDAVLASAVTEAIVPLLDLLADVNVSQDALDVAVHAHPAWTVNSR